MAIDFLIIRWTSKVIGIMMLTSTRLPSDSHKLTLLPVYLCEIKPLFQNLLS